MSPFVFVCLSPSCRLLGPGDVLGKSALSPLVFFHLSPSFHLLRLGDFLRDQLCLLLFSSTCLLAVTCLGSVIFLGLFFCLCFPLLVSLHSALSPLVLSTCPLPVACLGRVMFFGSQLCLPLFSSTCLHPVTCLGSVIFLGLFFRLCFPLLVKFSSFVFLYLSPSCHLLGPGDFLWVIVVSLCFPLFASVLSLA